MKTLLLLSALVITTLLIYRIDNFEKIEVDKVSLRKNYSDGIQKSELKNLTDVANYKLDVTFDENSKTIFVKENISWINKSSFSTKEIYLHLYANAYKSNNTIFANFYKLTGEMKTQLDISQILVNNKNKNLIFVNKNHNFQKDSTVAKIILDFIVLPSDSINIYIEYKLKIPLSVKRMGYAKGSNFYFVSQWFPKIGVFENGKWVCEPYYPYLNFYSDFGRYEVSISVPKKFRVASTGVEKERIAQDKYVKYYFVQNGVHDFAWAASDYIFSIHRNFKRQGGSPIDVELFIQPERQKYIERYFKVIFNGLNYFEEKVGEYPYQKLTMVEVPVTSASGGMEYPTLFTVSSQLFSPIDIHSPEKLVAHEFSHQFYYGILANNEVTEAWLDEGFASFSASKIMKNYYGKGFLNFKFVKYIPIYGLNFLSYHEIPIIYTLGKIPYTEYDRSFYHYQKTPTLGAIADTSFKLPTKTAYRVNAYSKPELMLHSLEKILGSEKFYQILKVYYQKFKFKHPRSKDFWRIVKKYAPDLDWFSESVFKGSSNFDYKIKNIKQKSSNSFDVFLERLGDGKFKSEVVFYTSADTVRKIWNGKERWKILNFVVEGEPIGAEIDPDRKNLFDKNFANNSLKLKPDYWSVFSLSANWFFWIQNALMIFGSI